MAQGADKGKVDAVLACADLDAARHIFPEVIERALKLGPGEAVFRSHWKPGTQYHDSLRFMLREVMGQMAEGLAQAHGTCTVDAVLTCADVDQALTKFPKVMKKALDQGPGEAVFRSHWLPGAQYHQSLREMLVVVVAEIAEEIRQKTEATVAERRVITGKVDYGVASTSVLLRRKSNGISWGFFCNKEMKIVLVNADSPASNAGLDKGTFVLEANGTRCLKPSDAYGPDEPTRYAQGGFQKILELELTVSQQKVLPAEEPDTKKEAAPEDTDFAFGKRASPPAPKRPKGWERALGGRERDKDRGPTWDLGWPAVSVPGHPWPVCELPPPGSSPAVKQGEWEGLTVRLVFLAIGASNMAGRARLPVSDAWCDRGYVLDARGRWQPAREPVHPPDGRGEGSGPILPFARRLVELLPAHAGVFVVPGACAGTKAGDWQPGSPLFTAAVKRATLGTEACGGILSGILWHLGEADAEDVTADHQKCDNCSGTGKHRSKDPRSQGDDCWHCSGRGKTADHEGARRVGPFVKTMVDGLREELQGKLRSDDVPFIAAQLCGASSVPGYGYSCHLINQSYTKLTGDRMDINTDYVERGKRGPWTTQPAARVRVVGPEQLSCDGRVLNLRSCATLGRRFADTWWDMEGRKVFPDQDKQKSLTWGQ